MNNKYQNQIWNYIEQTMDSVGPSINLNFKKRLWFLNFEVIEPVYLYHTS